VIEEGLRGEVEGGLVRLVELVVDRLPRERTVVRAKKLALTAKLVAQTGLRDMELKHVWLLEVLSVFTEVNWN